MKRHAPLVLLALVALAIMLWQGWPARQPASSVQPQSSASTVDAQRGPAAPPASVPLSALPDEAHHTLRLIRSRGPYPHRQDGQTFHNRERLLPLRERGWYRAYTVSTPGAGDRGARRIVAGGDPAVEFWYTRDHYRSFQRIDSGGESLP